MVNEPKRRGRPPKAKPEPVARVEGADIIEPHINGDTSREPEEALPVKGLGEQVMEAMDRIPREDTPFVQAKLAEKQAEIARRQAQNYALRVWSGQSETLPRSVRLARVKAALEGQGLPFDGVQLP